MITFGFHSSQYVNPAIWSDTFTINPFSSVSGISRNITESSFKNLLGIPFNWILTFDFNFVKNNPF